MNPYLHEFLQRLRSRATVGLIVVVLLAMGASASDVNQQISGVVLTGAGFSYFENGSYHIEIWALDDTGHGVGGVRVQLAFSAIPNSTVFPLPPPFLYVSVTTGASGTADALASIAPGNYSVSLSSSDPRFPLASFEGVLSGGFVLGPSPPGQLTMLASAVSVVNTGSYVTAEQLLAFWADENGTPPAGDVLEGCAPVTSSGYPPPANCSGLPTERIGSLSGYLSYFAYPALPVAALAAYQQVFLTAELVAPNGTIVTATSLAGPSGPRPAGVTVPSFRGVPPGVSALTNAGIDLGFFLPLGGFLLVYWGTTQPRFGGSTDMVLVRPVTRRGLFLTRFAAVVFLVGIAATVEILFFGAIASLELGASLPATFAIALIAAGLVAAVAFSELIFLASHVFRTTGPTLGIGIGLVLVGSLFWSVLVGVLYTVRGFTPDDASRLQLLPPLQYLSVIAGALTGAPIYTGADTSYAMVGISGAAIVAVGAAWVVVPLLLTLRRVERRD